MEEQKKNQMCIRDRPKGTAIPETRIELAEVLWKDAGQPAPCLLYTSRCV